MIGLHGRRRRAAPCKVLPGGASIQTPEGPFRETCPSRSHGAEIALVT